MDLFYEDTINAGTLVVFTLPNIRGQANLFVFTDPAPQGETFVDGVIITRINSEQRTNTQFQQSLENVIYVYSFGDQIGDLQISGLAFPRRCKDDKNGIQELIKFYREHRVSRRVQRVQITFANEVINGFIVGMALSTVDASSGAHNFNLLLKTLPAAFRRSQSAPRSTLYG
jgi:hypothetical protein